MAGSPRRKFLSRGFNYSSGPHSSARMRRARALPQGGAGAAEEERARILVRCPAFPLPVAPRARIFFPLPRFFFFLFFLPAIFPVPIFRDL